MSPELSPTFIVSQCSPKGLCFAIDKTLLLTSVLSLVAAAWRTTLALHFTALGNLGFPLQPEASLVVL